MIVTTTRLKRLIRRVIKETLQSHVDEPVLGDQVVNVNPGCEHYGSEGEVIDIFDLEDGMGSACEYECSNSGPKWDIGDLLIKTLDQLEKADIELQFR